MKIILTLGLTFSDDLPQLDDTYLNRESQKKFVEVFRATSQYVQPQLVSTLLKPVDSKLHSETNITPSSGVRKMQYDMTGSDLHTNHQFGNSG